MLSGLVLEGASSLSFRLRLPALLPYTLPFLLHLTPLAFLPSLHPPLPSFGFFLFFRSLLLPLPPSQTPSPSTSSPFLTTLCNHPKCSFSSPRPPPTSPAPPCFILPPVLLGLVGWEDRALSTFLVSFICVFLVCMDSYSIA